VESGDGPIDFEALMNHEIDALSGRCDKVGVVDAWSGLRDLDRLLGEPVAGNALEVECDSAMVRSAFLMGAAIAAARSGKRTLYVSGALAMPETRMRLMAQLSGVSLRDLREARLSEPQWSLITRAAAEPLPLSTWSLSAEPQPGELGDVPPMGSFDVVVIDGCEIAKLAREALIERCWVLTSRMLGRRTDITKDWIRLRLKPLRTTDSQLVSVEAVVVESALCPEGSVGLAFDGSCLRFGNAEALNPSMN